MSNFRRNNLNNIKNIVNEQTGVDLPESKPVATSKIVGIILAVIFVLTPLTAYGARYTMNFVEYMESEKNVKAEAQAFVEDLIGFAYGDTDTYLNDDNTEDSFYDFLRNVGYLFKKDNYEKTTYKLKYSLKKDVQVRSYVDINEGTQWFITAYADVVESNYQGVLDEFVVSFFLKYEGFGKYFTLTDMYFYDSRGYSELVFGDIGRLENTMDMTHFKAWAENTDDYSIFIEKIDPEIVDVLEFDSVKQVAKDFFVDYVNHLYCGESRFEDQQGQVYKLIDLTKRYLEVRRSSDYIYVPSSPDGTFASVSRLEKIGQSWYVQVSGLGSFFDEDGTEISAHRSKLFLKYTNVDGEFLLEDIYMIGGANSEGFKIFFGGDISELASFEDFITWADETDDYSEYLDRSYDRIYDFLEEENINAEFKHIVDSFTNASFFGGENIWDNGDNDTVTEFIRELVDYLSVSSDNAEVKNRTIETDYYPKSTAFGEDLFGVARVDIIEELTDGTTREYRTKVFVMYEYDGRVFKVTDFYYFGTLPQCSKVFDKVGSNTFSLNDDMFLEWAKENNDYSVYTQKIRAAMAELNK